MLGHAVRILRRMITYWCLFFDASGYLFRAANIDAADDAEIIAEARAIQAQHEGSGYEIRDDKRLVAYVTHHAAATG
jgi:hypothetical protein